MSNADTVATTFRLVKQGAIDLDTLAGSGGGGGTDPDRLAPGRVGSGTTWRTAAAGV